MNHNCFLIFFIFFSWISYKSYIFAGSLPCKARDFGFGSFVCICNATYCDTVEPNVRLPEGTCAVYTSNKAGLRLEKTYLHFTDHTNSTDAVLSVHRNVTYQSILGFGGAFTDAAGINIASLSQSAQQHLISSYYSSEGIEYSLGRIPMASCDFSTHPYSYDDWSGDFKLANFSLAEEDYRYKIPMIQKAFKIGSRNLTIFGSPWSAPRWMKDNQNMTGKGTLIGQPGGKYYKTWAMYFVKFLEEYAKHNISLWGITVQNEPTDGYITNFPFQAMGFTPEQERDFILKDLGPTLEGHGWGNVKVMILDDQRTLLPYWAKVIMSDPVAYKYVAGFAVHWYNDFFTPVEALDLAHNAFPDKFILYTEACEGSQPWQKPHPVVLGSWERAEAYSGNIMEDLLHWSVGWTDWNLALDMKGGPNWVNNFVDSPIIVNSEMNEFYKQPMFYILGHFSKFLPKGSVRIKSTLSQNSQIDHVAFLTPEGSTVVIVRNKENKAVPLTLHDEFAGFSSAVLSPRSIQTYIWFTK